MFIDPRIAIDEGWITGIKNPEKQVQPNAIDFTMDKAFFIATSPFYITEKTKQMRGGREYPPGKVSSIDEPGWEIYANEMLDALSDMYVTLPQGVAAVLVPRSTLTRNGLMIANGLYDTGFEGHIGTVVHNLNGGPAFVGQGTRIGQIIFVESKNATVYAGGYNHDAGTALHYQRYIDKD